MIQISLTVSLVLEFGIWWQVNDIFLEISKVWYYWKLQDANANDIALMIEFVVESRSIAPTLHPSLVAARNTGHCTIGVFTVCVDEGGE